jgi:predicted phosphate transport protein (TIGR00153 family)
MTLFRRAFERRQIHQKKTQKSPVGDPSAIAESHEEAHLHTQRIHTQPDLHEIPSIHENRLEVPAQPRVTRYLSEEEYTMKSTNPMAALFGKSPFKPIQAHMRIVIECVAEVPPLFQALVDGDQSKLEAQKKLIFEKEQAADEIKNQLRGQLPKSLLMPVDRRDLLDVLAMQDSIADTAQDIAGLLVERKMEVPQGMAEPLVALVNRCIDTCNKAGKIIEELDELVELGFRGREASQVEVMVADLNLIEDETDEMGMQLTRSLFAQEDSMSPVSVMFWYQLIQWIGDLADYSEKVGDRLRLLIAH